jgi:hypothetical protein
MLTNRPLAALIAALTALAIPAYAAASSCRAYVSQIEATPPDSPNVHPLKSRREKVIFQGAGTTQGTAVWRATELCMEQFGGTCEMIDTRPKTWPVNSGEAFDIKDLGFIAGDKDEYCKALGFVGARADKQGTLSVIKCFC